MSVCRVLISHEGKSDILSDNEIRGIVDECLMGFSIEKNCELSLFFCGKDKAKELNRKYRKRSYVPQVLSFKMGERDVDGVTRLGDIVICVDKFFEDVSRTQESKKKIIKDWICHGLANICR